MILICFYGVIEGLIFNWARQLFLLLILFIFRMNEVIVEEEPVNLRLQEIDLLQGDGTEGIEQIFFIET